MLPHAHALNRTPSGTHAPHLRSDGSALARGAEQLASVAAAEAAGVALKACSDLQDAAVGLYDAHLSRFAISDSQARLPACSGCITALCCDAPPAQPSLASRSTSHAASLPQPHAPLPSQPSLLYLTCAPPCNSPDHGQRRTLGVVGASGRRGALQNDLATAMGIENRNFFYVVKVGGGWGRPFFV